MFISKITEENLSTGLKLHSQLQDDFNENVGVEGAWHKI